MNANHDARDALLDAIEPEDDVADEAPPATGAALAPDTAGGTAPARGRPTKKLRCAITGKRFPRRELIAFDEVRPALAERILKDHPDLSPDALIARAEVARYRGVYVEELLTEEHGEFTELDRRVAESLALQDTLAENVEDDFEEGRTFGDRMADGLASFGGSWAFLLSFAGVLIVWMGINIAQGEAKAFDPYPFILLNLVLSTLAAVQAPIIMMSQRRTEAKDRLRSLNDYQVNLKAELEIRHLHEKMDHLIQRQWQRLAEIQRLQLETMQEKRPRGASRPAPHPDPLLKDPA